MEFCRASHPSTIEEQLDLRLLREPGSLLLAIRTFLFNRQNGLIAVRMKLLFARHQYRKPDAKPLDHIQKDRSRRREEAGFNSEARNLYCEFDTRTSKLSLAPGPPCPIAGHALSGSHVFRTGAGQLAGAFAEILMVRLTDVRRQVMNRADKAGSSRVSYSVRRDF
jgi:hypothetical protein